MQISKNVVLYELDNKLEKPFDKAIYKDPLAKGYSGLVTTDGEWAQEPAAGWKVSKISTGVFKIEHFLCNKKFSLNLSLINDYGNIKIGEVHDMYFTVEITQNNEPIDKVFTFSISFIPKILGQFPNRLR